ncbi:MAG: hypothetical protein QXV42_02620 [Ignisphaera sp.]
MRSQQGFLRKLFHWILRETYVSQECSLMGESKERAIQIFWGEISRATIALNP